MVRLSKQSATPAPCVAFGTLAVAGASFEENGEGTVDTIGHNGTDPLSSAISSAPGRNDRLSAAADVYQTGEGSIGGVELFEHPIEAIGAYNCVSQALNGRLFS